MSKPKFAIVGAGLGGLFAGILLQRAGYECKIYEQSTILGNVGAGINLAPNSTRMFAALGLEKAFRAAGIEPSCKYSRHFETGEIMFAWPVRELTELYGAPFLAFHRAALHSVLASNLVAETIVVGKHLIGLADSGMVCTLRFSDGSIAQADAVIGADGVHSKVRDAISEATNLKYHGLVAYRALVPVQAAKVPIDDNAKWWAPDRYVIIYFLSERRDVAHFVAATPELSDGFAPSEADQDVFYAAFSEFHPSVTSILRAAPAVTRWPLIEGTPFRPWWKGNVVLLGDACHATTPHMGQGAGMAFEDASVLVRCIAENDFDLSAAFAKYEHNRHGRTARIQAESHDNQWAKATMDHKWVYGYDAMTVQLEDSETRYAAAVSENLRAPRTAVQPLRERT
jgi:6-hydroxynicotinate 3-monooxygenase